MQSFDAQAEARVWSRVHGSTDAENDGGFLPGLILEEYQTAAMLQQLSRRFQGKERLTLQRLAREEGEHAACLRGVCRLMTGNVPQYRPLPAQDSATEILLRKCYASKMRALAAYESRCAGEYGPAFVRLVREEREHACRILELLGK